MTNKLRVVNNGGSLSETDLELLAGTSVIYNMMRNRIIVVQDADSNGDIDWSELTKDIKGLYHIRPLDKSKLVYQVWFELSEDKNVFEKALMIHKLAEA
jgi:hypothetical protein